MLVGRPVAINGRPYLFQRRLGAGGFGNVSSATIMQSLNPHPFFPNKNIIGAVYEARATNGMPVAVKVLMLSGIPRPQMEGRVKSFLNEVSLLNRLRQESRHVVVIYDFGFSPQAGQGKSRRLPPIEPLLITHTHTLSLSLFSLYRHGTRSGEFIEINYAIACYG